MEIKIFEYLDDSLRDEIEKLEKQVFADSHHQGKFGSEAQTKPNLLTLIAYQGSVAVGFKVGYALNERYFYSWLGGVLSGHRGQGLATELMVEQHRILKEKGYSYVRTNGRNKYREMLILNLKQGFNIIGTQYYAEEDQLSIALEKPL